MVVGVSMSKIQALRPFSATSVSRALEQEQEEGKIPPNIYNRFVDAYQHEVRDYKGSALDKAAEVLLLTEVVRGMWVGA
jgi:NADH dehydrogenase (ubiquinone) Fe-S protein 8